MLALSTAYLGLLYLMPDAVGTLLFKGKWVEAQDVMLPLSLAMVVSTASLGPAVVIYALGLARKTFRLIVIEAPLVFVLMVGGTVAYGVEGAAWGQFADQSIVLLLWFTTLAGVLAARRRPPPDEARDEVPDDAGDEVPVGHP